MRAVDSVSILGFGAFGRFMARHLTPHVAVSAFDREPKAQDFDGVRHVSLAEAAAADAIVLAVPVQHMESLLRELAPHVNSRVTSRAGESPLVLDVASVKLKPVELMTRLLPPSVPIIATHPLFGPESGKLGIENLPLAFCPVRAEAALVNSVRSFLADTLRLRLIDSTPDEHDRQMAYVQGLTHLISRAVGEMRLPETPLATAAYERFLAMRSNLRADSWELFVTIERENPYAKAVRDELRRTLDELERRLG
ncbi:MAG: prephenate dehydrogenase/arogenate dehydrogenase family protein [Phycisphaerales bacterium]|nr:prephenate dehydrogenase/arogenate dehydrogenase family protein [Phycisphaerales bacterium]